MAWAARIVVDRLCPGCSAIIRGFIFARHVFAISSCHSPGAHKQTHTLSLILSLSPSHTISSIRIIITPEQGRVHGAGGSLTISCVGPLFPKPPLAIRCILKENINRGATINCSQIRYGVWIP